MILALIEIKKSTNFTENIHNIMKKSCLIAILIQEAFYSIIKEQFPDCVRIKNRPRIRSTFCIVNTTSKDEGNCYT